MKKFPILKSNSLDQNDNTASNITKKDTFKVINKILRDKKEICKSVDHLFTRPADVDAYNNENEKDSSISSPPTSSAKTNFLPLISHQQQRKRNSRSEENLVDILTGAAECFGFNLKTKSISCESNNEFKKEETEKQLARALNERLKATTLEESTVSFDKELTIKNCGNNSCEPLEADLDNMMPPVQQPQPGVVTDSQGLIVPKKLANPCLESKDRKNLHRELMFNQKVGKNVLNQKSELEKALQKQKERQIINAQLQQQQQKEQCLSGELGRVIMQRAQRLEGTQKESNQDDINNQLNPEYLNARAKLRATIDSK